MSNGSLSLMAARRTAESLKHRANECAGRELYAKARIFKLLEELEAARLDMSSAQREGADCLAVRDELYRIIDTGGGHAQATDTASSFYAAAAEVGLGAPRR